MARCVALALAAGALGQQMGTNEQEQHPPMPLWTCTASGCTKEQKSLTLDANWRWIHNGQSTNCYKDSEWDASLCPDPTTCSKNCYLEGASLSKYESSYGVSAQGNGVELSFVTKTKYGDNFGSRLYMLEDENEYKMFKLKNREFTISVDMDHMPCGLNGAVYFVEMDADGGKSKSGGLNAAGAKYGTGYCDAQCPHDMKFIDGEANVLDWNSTHDPPIGKYGACCAEMDIWEANSRATAYTPHPCSVNGTYRCDGVECGDNEKDQRYDGVCDKDGCDFNSYRMGDKMFYGRHMDFVVDSAKELTVVTQFITEDGTDSGELVDIRRFYVQDGKVVPNSNSSIAGVHGNSITDSLCNEMKTVFGDINDFKRKGGLKGIGEALERGMVLVMSLWDDSLANMLWLDSDYPLDEPASKPGVARGPCLTTTGKPSYLREKYPSAAVKYYDIKVGTIGSTYGSTSANSGGSGDPWGDDRRLKGEVLV